MGDGTAPKNDLSDMSDVFQFVTIDRDALVHLFLQRDGGMETCMETRSLESLVHSLSFAAKMERRHGDMEVWRFMFMCSPFF